MMTRVLIVDDEFVMAKSLARSLTQAGYEVEVTTRAEEGVRRVMERRPDIVLLDLKFQEMDGLTALRQIRAFDPSVLVIVITAYGSIETAVEAMKAGAVDFLSKPLDLQVLRMALERALEADRLRHELSYYRARALETAEGGEIIGQSPALQRVWSLIDKVSRVDVGSAGDLPTVLILGETGTGKDLVARTIHRRSPLARQPFVEVDCAVLPPTLLETELFGYERGAFTDARSSKAGLVEIAEGGTLFFNEVGDLPLETQGKLLTLIEKKRFRRVGGVSERTAHIRIIAATNRDLERAVREGTFRSDLFYRLKVFTIELPPLRARGDDIRLLAEYFLDRFTKKYRTGPKNLTPAAMDALLRYPWPGNVRELAHVIERAVLTAEGEAIDLDLLGLGRVPVPSGPEDLGLRAWADDEWNIQQIERRLIQRALAITGGNLSAAARKLGLTRETLRYRVRKYGIVPPHKVDALS
ncbi:MAG: sigma-54 dependent transcriptional regulator [Acidobacteria bacterium]|nr:sigma-54 dependent transcriptional regulator [Acidobacteriota bacterium]MDW7983346.1 sigma-54 dependent transcriptional regulator [Acidobacteriota bacterium]